MKRLLSVAVLVVWASACDDAKTPKGVAEQKAAEQNTTPSPPPEWQTVADWSGSGIKQTESFTTASREWRIYWKTKNEAFAGAGLLQIMVYQADNDALITLAANKQGTGSDVTYVRAKPGRYYLAINSANVEWVVRVEDQRPISDKPEPPSEYEKKVAAEMRTSAKEKAAKDKVSGEKATSDMLTLFIGELIRVKLITNMDDNLQNIYVNGNTWGQMDRDRKEVIVRRLAEYREIKKGSTKVVIYDGKTERELASYSAAHGIRFR